MQVYDPNDVVFRGCRMGKNQPLVVTNIDMGDTDFRVHDADNPLGDDRFFGRDYLTPPVWSLTVRSITDSTAVLKQAVNELLGLWVTPSRRNPGAYQVLRFESDGKMYKVYGRPRKFGADVNQVLRFGGGTITLDFVLSLPYIFDDDWSSVTLRTFPSPRPGLIFKAEAPFIFGQSSGPRQGEINNTGTTPTPLRVTFSGPSTNPKVWSDSGNWLIEVRTTIPYDKTVVVDTVARTVTRSDGANLSAMVSRKTDLGARIAPGRQEVFYQAVDRDGVSTAKIDWLSGGFGI